MKILITGTAVFIGFHLANYLLARGDEVFGLDCINDYYDINLKYNRLSRTGIEKEQIEYGKSIKSSKSGNYQFIQLNLIDREKINLLFQNEKFDTVCHLAAQAGVRYSIYIYVKVCK
jgi:UDP-glucuronate 4-epimerase